MRRELLYVGCSRARTLQDLNIDGVFIPPSAPGPLDSVTQEMARLQATSGPLSLRFLQDVNSDTWKIVFHNVQRLMPHLLDIFADHSTMTADVLAFVEPWLTVGDHPRLEGFVINSRTNSQTTPNSYGSILFSRPGTRIEDTGFSSTICRQGHINATTWTLDRVYFVMIYSHPTVNFRELTHFLTPILHSRSEHPTVVLGDFNLNLLSDARLLKFFITFGMKEVTTRIPSTDYRTKLDACFSNIQELDA